MAQMAELCVTSTCAWMTFDKNENELDAYFGVGAIGKSDAC